MPDDRGCVIVTGAGRGIGKAISLAMAENGWSVACLSRTETEIMQVAEEIRSKGGDARHFPAESRQTCQGYRILTDSPSMQSVGGQPACLRALSPIS